jgi:hypothetical protein
MENTLKEILEGLLNTLDPSKEVVTESIREDMTSKFIATVTEAVKAESAKVDEAAVAKMDELNQAIDTLKESHEAEKAELLSDSIIAVKTLDESFADLLTFTVEQFDEVAVGKLEQCKEAFDKALESEIEDLCESVEAIIETKLETANADEDIAGLAKLDKLEAAFESMREIFFKEAVLDEKVNESVGSMKEDYDKLLTQNITLAKKLNKIEVDSYLESETEGLKPALKDYMIERFENSKIADVKELWESAEEDFKKLDEENRQLAKKSVSELDVDPKLDESEEDEPEKELTESEEYYENAANGYSQFFKKP